MKKNTYDKAIKLLKEKNKYTYKEISQMTGYHPKSLVRLNSAIKNNKIKVSDNDNMKSDIIKEYMNSKYSKFSDFYKFDLTYDISYSTLTKIFNNIIIDKDFIIVQKIKEKGNYYFKIIDYKTRSLLFKFSSLKNDKESIKEIIYTIINRYGLPNDICFSNFFKTIPVEIKNLLLKYNIELIPFKSIYRIKDINEYCSVEYKKVIIDKRDFYNIKIRRTIDTNMIQFNNTRYLIDTLYSIDKNEEIKLYYSKDYKDIFITYKDKEYNIIKYKDLESKKGNTKYN